MHIIGLTGGIGSGKTTVAKYLRSKGFEVLDLDLMSRELVEPGKPALHEIVDAFGPAALKEDGFMNRKYVGRLVFSDLAYKRVLDSIMQRYMDDWILKRLDIFSKKSIGVTRQTNPTDYLQKTVLFMDAPLLFESHIINMVHESWVVDLDDEKRIDRIIKRDNFTREEVLKRFKAQMSREEKLERADKVIDNSGSVEDLFKNVDVAIEELDSRL